MLAYDLLNEPDAPDVESINRTITENLVEKYKESGQKTYYLSGSKQLF